MITLAGAALLLGACGLPVPDVERERTGHTQLQYAVNEHCESAQSVFVKVNRYLFEKPCDVAVELRLPTLSAQQARSRIHHRFDRKGRTIFETQTITIASERGSKFDQKFNGTIPFTAYSVVSFDPNPRNLALEPEGPFRSCKTSTLSFWLCSFRWGFKNEDLRAVATIRKSSEKPAPNEIIKRMPEYTEEEWPALKARMEDYIVSLIVERNHSF